MNFTQPSDFFHVNGDLDKITIDNNIMPVRSGDAKKQLRGMDIAFLKEAIEERRAACGLQYGDQNFTQAITSSQMSSIATRHNDMLQPCRFLSSEIQDADFPYSTNPYRFKEHPFLSDVQGCCTAHELDGISFSGNILENEVSSAYENISKMDVVCRELDYSRIQQTMTDETVFDRREDGTPTGCIPAERDYCRSWMTNENDGKAGLYAAAGGAPFLNAKYLYRTVATSGTISFDVPNDFDGDVEMWACLFAYCSKDPNWQLVSYNHRYMKISDTENFYIATELPSLMTKFDALHPFLAPPESYFVNFFDYVGVFLIKGIYPVLKPSNRTKWY